MALTQSRVIVEALIQEKRLRNSRLIVEALVQEKRLRSSRTAIEVMYLPVPRIMSVDRTIIKIKHPDGTWREITQLP